MFLVKRGNSLIPFATSSGAIMEIDAQLGGNITRVKPNREMLEEMTWDELRFMWSRFGIRLKNLSGKGKSRVVDYLLECWEEFSQDALRQVNEGNLLREPTAAGMMKPVFFKRADGLLLCHLIARGQVVPIETIQNLKWSALTEDKLSPLSVDQLKNLGFDMSQCESWNDLRDVLGLKARHTKKALMSGLIGLWQHLYDDHEASAERSETQNDSESNNESDDKSESEESQTVTEGFMNFNGKAINPEVENEAVGKITIKTSSTSCFFFYGKGTTVQDLKDLLEERFGIDGDTYRLYVDGSYLEPYDVIDTYLAGTSKVVQMEVRIKGGGKNKVIKTTLKCKTNTKTTNEDRALFEKAYTTALKIGGLTSASVDIKAELKLMTIKSLEEMKDYLLKDKTKKALKMEKLVTFLDAHKEMMAVQEKMSSALNSMKEMLAESADDMCSNDEGDIDFTDLLEFINKTIGGKERDEADAML